MSEMTHLPDLLPVLPEIFLAVGVMVLLMIGAFGGPRISFLVNGMSMGLIAATALHLDRANRDPAQAQPLISADAHRVSQGLAHLFFKVRAQSLEHRRNDAIGSDPNNTTTDQRDCEPLGDHGVSSPPWTASEHQSPSIGWKPTQYKEHIVETPPHATSGVA